MLLERIKLKIAELDEDIQYHKEEIEHHNEELEKAKHKKSLWEELIDEEKDEIKEAELDAEDESDEDFEEGEPDCDNVVVADEVREISYGAGM